MPTFDAGTARYRIEIDTSQFNSGLNNVITGTQKLDMAMNSTIKSGNALANNFKSVNNVFQAGATPLNNFQQQAGALPKAFDKIGDSAEKTGKRVKGIGEAFRNNKGLIFGGAGLASAAAEAAGMLGMYGDAVEQYNEAQKKLAEVNADATSSTQEVARAEQDAAKAKKWLSMSTRNLVLSQMDQVFFATMVISQLSQMNLKGGILGKTLGTLKTAFSGVAGAQGMAGLANGITAGGDALSGFATKASGASKVLTVLKANIGAVVAAIGGFTAALLIINSVQGSIDTFYKTIKAKPTNANLFDQIFDPKKFKEGTEEARTVSELTGASFLDLQKDAEGVGKKFLEMGGQVDKNGKIVALTADHYFSLGNNLAFVGKSSAQYIHWAAVKIAQGQTEAQVMKFLGDSYINADVAAKIYNVAKKDSVNIDLDGTTATEAYTQAVQHRTALETQANSVLNEYLKVSGQSNVTTEQGMEDLANYLQIKYEDIDATEGEKAKTEELIAKVMKLAQEKGKTMSVEEQLAAAVKESADAQALQNLYTETGIKNAGDASNEIMDLVDTNHLLADSFSERAQKEKELIAQQNQEIKLGILYGDTVENQLAQVLRLDEEKQKLKSTVIEENSAIVQQAQALGMNASEVEKYIQVHQDEIDVIKQKTDALHMMLPELAKEQGNLALGADAWKGYVDAQTAGIVSADEFLKKLKFGATEEKQYIERLNEFIPGLSELKDQFKLTNEQVSEYVTLIASGKTPQEALNAVMEKTVDIAKKVTERISQAQSSIADALGIKLKDKEKITKKLWDYFPNSIKKTIKSDIQFDLNLKTTKESIIDSMWTAIGADLPDEKMDKLVNQTIKFLREKFGEKNPEVKKMIDDLVGTVGSKDTASAVAAVIHSWEAAGIPVQITPENLDQLSIAVQAGLQGTTYSVLVQGQYAGMAKKGWNSIINPNSGERKGLVPNSATAAYAKSVGSTGGADLLTNVSQGNVPVTGIITKIAFGAGGGIYGGSPFQLPPSIFGNNPGENSTGGSGGGKSPIGGTDFRLLPVSGKDDKLSNFQKIIKEVQAMQKLFSLIEVAAQAAQTGIANFANQGSNSFGIISKAGQKTAVSINTYLRKTIPVAAQASQTGIANLANEGSNSLAMLSKVAGKTATSMNTYLRRTVPVAAQASQTSLANLSNQGSNSLMALAKASSKSMSGLVNNFKKGEQAAKSLTTALNNIPTNIVVHYSSTGSTAEKNAKGGVYSFAQGGTVSAAGGLTTVSQPTHFIYGDNPGNHETLAFIPHNNPGPIMDRLEKMFTRSSKNGIEVGQSITLNINGNDIVNSVKLNKRIRTVMGSNMDRFG